MHEANAVRSAINHAVAQRDAALAAARGGEDPEPPASDYRHLELDILDPTRATPEAVQLYAPVILDELGLRDVSFDVFVRAIRCALCGQLTHAEPADPVCRLCGGPVSRTEGPAIVARWTAVVRVAAGTTPAHDAASWLADHHRTHVARVIR